MIRDKFASNYPSAFYEKIEFDKIQDLLVQQCNTDLAKELCTSMRPMTDLEEIEFQLEITHEMKLILGNPVRSFPNTVVPDVRQYLKLLDTENAVLETAELWHIFKLILWLEEMQRFFDNKNEDLTEIFPKIYATISKHQIEKEILNQFKKIFDDKGKIKNSASKELTTIRNRMKGRHREIHMIFASVLKRIKVQGRLSDEEETIRNGRRVLSIAAEHKRKVKGMIVDESANGRVVYIEPEETLLLNNEVVELELAERREIYKILKDVSNSLKPYKEDLKSLYETLGEIDHIMAKARLAIRIKAVKPFVANEKGIELIDARHPILLLHLKSLKKEVVPLSLQLSIANRILLISGPNAGGKSVALKTLGLLQVMVQCGLLVPVDERSKFSIFNSFYCDIGDEQSIEDDLSTYSSHLKNMKHLVEFANHKSFVMVDEFGSGTDPKYGGAMAEAILQKVHENHCFGIFTTHYSNLKIFAEQSKGMVNGAMLFNKSNMSPTYTLEIGKPGSSFAFELAEKINLQKEIIDLAKSKIGSDYQEFDQLLSSMQLEKSVLDEKLLEMRRKEKEFKIKEERLEKELKELNKTIKEKLLAAENRSLSIVNEANRHLENLQREWKEGEAKEEIAKATRKKLKEEKQQKQLRIEALQKEVEQSKSTNEKPYIGALVKLISNQQQGKIIDIRKNKAIVEFGILKTQVKLTDLEVLEPAKHVEETKTHYVKYNTFESTINFKSSLDVRGKRREEALDAVQYFIDQALLVSADKLKIIHGIGDGILKRSIRQMLRKTKHIKSIYSEEEQYGGEAITLVEIE